MKKIELIRERDAARTEAAYWKNLEKRREERLQGLGGQLLEAEKKARDWYNQAQEQETLLNETRHTNENLKNELKYTTEALERSIKEDATMREMIQNLRNEQDRLTGQLARKSKEENRLMGELGKANDDWEKEMRRSKYVDDCLTQRYNERQEARAWARMFYREADRQASQIMRLIIKLAAEERVVDAIVARLDQWEEAYSKDLYGVVSRAEIEQHTSLISRNSAAMGRFMVGVMRRTIAIHKEPECNEKESIP